MPRIPLRPLGLVAIGVALATVGASGVQPAQRPVGERPAVTKADVERWKQELTNWGRWGQDDQIGTLNLITPEKRKQAAALVRDGISVSLARDAETEERGQVRYQIISNLVSPLID